MTTDVQLVNRVRRKMREDDITATSDELSTAILDEINTAMVDVLESRMWDFDVRARSLLTQPTATSTNVGMTNGSPDFTAGLDDVTNVTIGGNYTWRICVTNASVHGETAWRIKGGSLTDTALLATIDENWPDTTLANNGTADLFVSEYQFPQHSDDGPSQVRQLLSMMHQNRYLDLQHISRQDFDRIITRPHDSLGTDPIRVYTGFDVIETGQASGGGAGTDYAPGFGIWPVPDDAIRLDYTYVFSHPEITSSQELEEVPRSVEDQIVWLAYARIMQGGVGNEPQSGLMLEQKVFGRLDDLHRGQKRDPLNRLVIYPHSARRLRDAANFGVIPRDVGSL